MKKLAIILLLVTSLNSFCPIFDAGVDPVAYKKRTDKLFKKLLRGEIKIVIEEKDNTIPENMADYLFNKWLYGQIEFIKSEKSDEQKVEDKEEQETYARIKAERDELMHKRVPGCSYPF